MKKGFTLVELLGVLVILSVIIITAAVSYTGINKRQKENYKNNLKLLMIDLTNEYLTENFNDTNLKTKQYTSCDSLSDEQEKVSTTKLLGVVNDINSNIICRGLRHNCSGSTENVFVCTVKIKAIYDNGYLSDDFEKEIKKQFGRDYNLSYDTITFSVFYKDSNSHKNFKWQSMSF